MGTLAGFVIKQEIPFSILLCNFLHPFFEHAKFQVLNKAKADKTTISFGDEYSYFLHWLEISLSLKETLAHANDCRSILIYILDEINIKQINANDVHLFHGYILLVLCTQSIGNLLEDVENIFNK